jgi:hypothetical protein
MASDITQYTQLKRIVSYFLDECEKSMGDYDKAWIIAFRALTEIGLNISFEPTTFRLPVNTGNMTVALPSGYLKWTKIGIINESGEVVFLKRNTSLTKWRDNNPNRLTSIFSDIPDQDVSQFASSPYFYNYYFGNTYSPYFGAGGGTLLTYGDFDVDEVNNLIVLQPNFQFADILLECIVSPQQNADYQIQTCCQEAVIAFLKWKFKMGTEQEYYSRLIEARRKLKPITLQEIQQAIRENMKYSLKA